MEWGRTLVLMVGPALAAGVVSSSPGNVEAEPTRVSTARLERRIDGGEPSGSGAVRREVVRVDVRMIRAAEPIADADLIRGFAPPALDPRLKDLTAQLSRLHYRRYTLVTSQSRDSEVMKRDSVALVNGHTLTLRPMYVQDGRVGMWIKWDDQNGHPVLDTRLHFRCGQTFIAGMDGEGELPVAESGHPTHDALILAIDAHPSR